MGNKYPECEKMAAVKDESQVIGEFLEWLQCERSIPMELAVWNNSSHRLIQCHTSTEQLLAEFFEIDLDKVEKERRQMLDELRKNQKKK